MVRALTVFVLLSHHGTYGSRDAPIPFLLATNRTTSEEHMWAASPPARAVPARTVAGQGCRAGGPHLKGTRIPCRVAITSKSRRDEACCWSGRHMTVHFFDNSDLLQYMAAYWPDMAYLAPDANLAEPPRSITWIQRADLWRYAYLYHHGGVYSDDDACPVAPIDEWIPDSLYGEAAPVDFVVATEQMRPIDKCGTPFAPFQLVQYAFAASPRSPILFHVLQYAHQQLLLGHPPLNAVGPRVFTAGVMSFIARYAREKGYRADGIPHALANTAREDGRSQVVKCLFRGVEVNILLLGTKAFGGSTAFTPGCYRGRSLVHHKFTGSWLHDQWLGDCGGDRADQLHPVQAQWARQHPVARPYPQYRSCPLLQSAA